VKTKNTVFIATSLDGYIADKNGSIDWLHATPNPDQIDMGYAEFTARIDALVMKPVYVLSNTLTELPQKYEGKAELVKGTLTEIIAAIHQNGHNRLYIDGGATIQGFLKDDLIDEMIITVIPVLLGGGSSLFSGLKTPLQFKCSRSEVFLDKIVQNQFMRVRS
jgi:dihydrofolate reductase